MKTMRNKCSKMISNWMISLKKHRMILKSIKLIRKKVKLIYIIQIQMLIRL